MNGRLAMAATVLMFTLGTSAQTATTFQYQGSLLDGGAPASGNYDVAVGLWDSASGGAQIGSSAVFNAYPVAGGLLNLQLDFGAAAFDNSGRWLEISVNGFTLSPRQPVTRVPYAIQTRGIFVDDLGQVGIGTTLPTAPLELQGETVPPDDFEPLFRVGVADAPTDYFLLRNGTGNTGQFISQLRGHHASDNRETVEFSGSTIAARDNGTRPIIEFGAHVFDGTAFLPVVTRPLFAWRSAGSTKMILTADGNLGLGTNGPITPLHIARTRPRIVLEDLDSTGAAQEGFMALIDSSGVETGWLGYGSTADTDLTVRNRIGLVSLAAEGGYLAVAPDGNVGIGTYAPQTKLDVRGTTRTEILEITGADLAERFPASEEVRAGMVVAIDPGAPGRLCLARGAYNRAVAGIVSGANDFSAGAILGNLPGCEDAPPVALSGRVYVYCDATTHAIEPTDLLTSSETPGHAMKVIDHGRAQGAIIGKAMTGLEQGKTGLVLVLVTLQ